MKYIYIQGISRYIKYHYNHIIVRLIRTALIHFVCRIFACIIMILGMYIQRDSNNSNHSQKRKAIYLEFWLRICAPKAKTHRLIWFHLLSTFHFLLPYQTVCFSFWGANSGSEFGVNNSTLRKKSVVLGCLFA